MPALMRAARARALPARRALLGGHVFVGRQLTTAHSAASHVGWAGLHPSPRRLLSSRSLRRSQLGNRRRSRAGRAVAVAVHAGPDNRRNDERCVLGSARSTARWLRMASPTSSLPRPLFLTRTEPRRHARPAAPRRASSPRPRSHTTATACSQTRLPSLARAQARRGRFLLCRRLPLAPPRRATLHRRAVHRHV